MKTRVLFVCLGNICRSPTAEAVFRSVVERAGKSGEIDIDSAGTIAAHAGEPADARMRKHAARRGYTLTSISRRIQLSDFSTFTHIVAMDRQNLADLKAMAPPGAPAGISLLLEFDPDSPVAEVPDPYYGGAEGFETVLDLIEAASEHFFAHLTS